MEWRIYSQQNAIASVHFVEKCFEGVNHPNKSTYAYFYCVVLLIIISLLFYITIIPVFKFILLLSETKLNLGLGSQNISTPNNFVKVMKFGVDNLCNQKKNIMRKDTAG